MQMQTELVSSCCIFCPTNDLKSGHCGHPPYGTNEYWDLCRDLFLNIPDVDPLMNIVSVKDSGSDAILANAQVGGNSQDIVC
jgi:hypothetical protein